MATTKPGEKNTNELLLDADVKNTAMYERFKAGMVRRHVNIFDEGFDELEELLLVAFIQLSRLERGTRRYQKAFNKFSNRIADKVDAIVSAREDALTTEFTAVAAVVDSMERKSYAPLLAVGLVALGLQARKKLITNTSVRGLTLNKRMDELTAVTLSDLLEGLGVTLNDNGTVGQSRRRTDAAIKKAARNLEVLIRTTATDVRARTKEEVYKRAGLERYLWNSVLDNRTTPICRSLDGKIFRVGKGPLPPQHFNCRSSTLALVPGGGKVDVINYEAWLRSQSAAEQDEILGQTKGRLFREEKLNLDIFVNRIGNPLTLDELAGRLGLRIEG